MGLIGMNISISFPAAKSLGWGELALSLGPHLMWIGLLLGVVWFIGPKKIVSVLLGARKLSFAGVEIELKGDLAEAAQSKNIDVPIQAQDQVTRRIQRLYSLFAGARVLWVDDNPSGNLSEIRLLRRLGVIIDLASDDSEARVQLARSVYDIVLSDMARGSVPDAGEKLMPDIGRSMLAPILIFYVGHDRPAPKGAFGLTARPDELFNLIMDALERRRD